MRLLLLIALASALAACDRDRPELVADLPGAATVVTPEVVIVERRVYVSVEPRLTRQEAVAEGPIAQCFSVAAQRRTAIERLNARMAEIAAIAGTEVEP